MKKPIYVFIKTCGCEGEYFTDVCFVGNDFKLGVKTLENPTYQSE
jgi:hypothetical protein